MVKQIRRVLQLNRNADITNTRRAIRYLDVNFRTMRLCFSWVVLKNVLNRQIETYQKAACCSKKEAQSVIWTMFIDINFVQEETYLLRDILDFIVSIDDDELPLYVLHLHIALSISKGISEENAIAQYRQFLRETPAHAIFGDYAITQDFQIIPASEYRMRIPKELASTKPML